MATADPQALLEAHPLVAPLHDDERSLVVPSVELRRVTAGTVLIEEGDPPGALLLVLAGTVTVSRRGVEVAQVGPGSWIGELSLLEGRPARARVTADDDLLVGVVEGEGARRALDLDGVALQLDSLARRRWAANRAQEVTPVPVPTRGGGEALLRPVIAADWRALAEGDRTRVSEHSLRMRFFSEPPRSERRFRQLTDLDFRDEFAWAALVDGELAGIGRYSLQAEDRSIAELAVLVADDVQGLGLGSALLRALVLTAEVHGADELLAVTRDENEPIRRLLGRMGAEFGAARDAGVVRAVWPLATALASVPTGRTRDAFAAVARFVLAPVVDD